MCILKNLSHSLLGGGNTAVFQQQSVSFTQTLTAIS